MNFGKYVLAVIVFAIKNPSLWRKECVKSLDEEGDDYSNYITPPFGVNWNEDKLVADYASTEITHVSIS